MARGLPMGNGGRGGGEVGDRRGWGTAAFCGVSLGAGLMAVACGSPLGDHPAGFDFGDAGDAGEFGSSATTSSHAKAKPDASGVTMLGPPDTGAAPVDCPPNATLIYVTGVESGVSDVGSNLYSFDPQAAKFHLIGAMSCLSGPTHMTVDRQGTAWVVAGGDIYRASTVDAKCSKVSTWKPDVDFSDFALTFLGTTSATDDSLYLLGDTGTLGVFNVSTGALTKLGSVTIPAAGDMTTNGDGTLYYMEQATMQTLNELNPSNAAIHQSWKTGEDSGGQSQALAFYGGVFYFFIDNAAYTYDVATGVTKSIGTAPLYVTGAGQSTCVPADAGPPAALR